MSSSTKVNRKARYWSLGAVGLGVAVVLIATFSSRRFILEEWHLSSLESGDKEKRERAAKALGDNGSVRAIPLLTQASCESSGDDFEETVSVMAQIFADVSVLSLTSPFKISVASLGGLSTRRLRAFRVNQSVSLDRQFEDLAKQVADRLTDNPHPPQQTEMMRDALIARGVPVACIMFEGEGHGFRDARNQITALESELSFFGQVLGFEPAGDIQPVAIVGL